MSMNQAVVCYKEDPYEADNFIVTYKDGQNEEVKEFNELKDVIDSIEEKQCTKLIIAGFRFGDDVAIAIAEALKTNKFLTNLDLSSNIIGSKGAIAIAEALKTNTVLTSLNLSSNAIRSEDAIAIAEALKFNKALTNLDLSSNIIGDEGAIAIAEALKVNIALINLNLYHNAIEPQGILCILEALKTNRALAIFNFSDNVNSVVEKAISSLLEVNCNLISINKEHTLNYKQAAKYLKTTTGSDSSIFGKSEGFSVHYYAAILNRKSTIEAILIDRKMNSAEIQKNFDDLRREFLKDAFRILGVCKHNPLVSLPKEIQLFIFSFITSQDIIDLSNKFKDKYKAKTNPQICLYS